MQIDENLLKGLDSKHLSQKEIAKQLGTSQSSVSRALHKLNKGMNNSPQSVESGMIGNQNPQFIRLHALALEYRFPVAIPLIQIEDRLATHNILYEPEPLGTAKGGKPATYLYFFKQDGLQARLTSHSLTIWAKEKTAPVSEYNARRLHDEASQQIREAASHADEMLNLGIAEVNGETYEEHIAFANDDGAKEAIRERQPIRIKDDLDEKIRFLVDASKGVPEAEFVHALKSQPDALKYAGMVEDVIKFDGWQRMKDSQQAFAQNLAEHVALIKDIRKLLPRFFIVTLAILCIAIFVIIFLVMLK